MHNPFLFDKETPRVFFIDGPSGIGKDTYIEYLYDYFTNELKLDKSRVKVLRATDYVLTDFTQSENRKYIQYQTAESQLFHIYTSHFKLLEHIDQLFLDSIADVVIVNRSFMSFLIYNVFPIIKTTDLSNTPYEHAFEVYKHANFTFPYSEVYYCNLTFKNKNAKEATLLLEKRITSRNDNKEIDLKWIKSLFTGYEKTTKEYATKFVDYVSTIDCENPFTNEESLPWLQQNLLRLKK